MAQYFLKRLLLMIPTLFGILTINFIIIQAAPGGPVDQMIAKMRGLTLDATARFGGSGDMSGSPQNHAMNDMSDKYRGARGLDPEFIKEIERMYGFDKPAYERFWIMIKNYLRFDLGDSYFRDISVISLIKEKLPVSVSLGLWSTLLI